MITARKRPAEAGLGLASENNYAPGGGVVPGFVFCGVVGGVPLGGLVVPGAGEFGFDPGVVGVVSGVGFVGVVSGVGFVGVVCGVGVFVVSGVVPGVEVPGGGVAVPGVGAAVPGVGLAVPGVVPGCVVPG